MARAGSIKVKSRFSSVPPMTAAFTDEALPFLQDISLDGECERRDEVTPAVNHNRPTCKAQGASSRKRVYRILHTLP